VTIPLWPENSYPSTWSSGHKSMAIYFFCEKTQYFFWNVLFSLLRFRSSPKHQSSTALLKSLFSDLSKNIVMTMSSKTLLFKLIEKNKYSQNDSFRIKLRVLNSKMTLLKSNHTIKDALVSKANLRISQGKDNSNPSLKQYIPWLYRFFKFYYMYIHYKRIWQVRLMIFVKRQIVMFWNQCWYFRMVI